MSPQTFFFRHGSFRKKFDMSIRKTHTKTFGIRDSGFGVRDSGFGIRDSGFGVRGSGWSGQDSLVSEVAGRRYRLPVPTKI